MKNIITTLFALILMTPLFLPAQSISVSVDNIDNCINTPIAGTYTASGTYNGRTKYVNTANSNSRFQWNGSRWDLVAGTGLSANSVCYYSSVAFGTIPPCGYNTVWTAAFGCFAITVSGDCNAGVSSITAPVGNVTGTTASYTVNFSASVSNLSTSNFSITTTNISGASVASVSGSGSTWTVVVNVGTVTSGTGTIQLCMNNNTGVSPTLEGLPTCSASSNVIQITTAPTLAVGDVAFTSYLSNSTADQFSFVPLVDISAGTEIYFTDNGWTGSDFNAAEGIQKWTTSSSIAKGTEITITGTSASQGTISDFSNASTGLLLGSSGDQIFAFQGPSSNRVILTGIHMNVETSPASTSNAWDTWTTSSSSRSAKPSALTTGTNALWSATEYDNGKLNCSGLPLPTAAEVRAYINTPSNWTFNNTNPAGFSSPASCAAFFSASCTPPTVYTVSGSNANCPNSATLSLSDSESGVNYQLKKDGADFGSPLAGTGSALSLSVNAAGGYTIVATRTSDGCTQNMTGSFDVQADNDAPTVTCPDNLTANTSAGGTGDCATTVTWTAPTPTDNCSASIQSLSHASGSSFETGSTTVSYVAVDPSGNTAYCEFEVIVFDNEAPSIICPANATANSSDDGTGDCETAVTWTDPTPSDNCGAGIADVSYTSGSSFAVGSTTVTYTAEDAATNAATCSFTVTVLDDEAPSIACPANATVAANGSCGGVLGSYALASKTDNCTASGSIAESQDLDASTALSGHDDEETLVLTATDEAGNVSTCSFTITLKDVSVPSITCPANTTLAVINNCFRSVGSYSLASKTDNCTTSGSISESQDLEASTLLDGHNDAKTIVMTATDAAGNTSTCSFTVTLKDVTPPAAPSSMPDENNIYTATPTPPTAPDVCAGTVMATSNVTFPITAAGTTTITWAFNDGNGNTSTVAQNVNIDADLDDDGYALGPDCDDLNADIRPDASEITGDGIDQNCDGTEICFKDMDDDGYRPNATAIFLSTTDTDCYDTCEAVSGDPTGDCNDTDAVCFPGNPEVCDGKDNNCLNGVPYTEADADSDGWRICAGDCADDNAARNPGEAEIVCNQIDDDCDTEIDNGPDVTPPTAACKTSLSVALSGGTASVNAAALNNGSTDACSGTTLSLSIVSGQTTFACADKNMTFSVTLQVADAASNTATCQSSVTVVDVLSYAEFGSAGIRTANGGAAGDRLGWGLALDETTVAAGALEAKVGTQNKQGAVYIFERNSPSANAWGQTKKRTAADGAAIDYFGNAVSLDGLILLVGAYGDNVGTKSDQGCAYVFSRDNGGANNWGQAQKLLAPDGLAYDYFGTSVATRSSVALVGASKAKVSTNTAQGAAYLYYKDLGGAENWGHLKKITASDGAASNLFGQASALNPAGTLALVGAPGNLSNRGAAYIFSKNLGGTDNWGQLKKLTASDAAIGDGFGTSAAATGSYALVGAPSKASNAGAAYIFGKDTGGTDNWGQVKKLTASDGAAGHKFGTSVSISGDYAYVGAPASGGTGAVYVFQKDNGGPENWGQVGRYVSPGSLVGDQYGFTVAASGLSLAVGSNLDDVASKADQGSFYILGGSMSCGDGMAAPGAPGKAIESITERTAQALDVRCSPNPFSDQLSVEVSASSAAKLTVTDAAGRVLSSVDLPAGQIRFDLSTTDFQPGLYFVQVSTEDGVRVVPVARVK